MADRYDSLVKGINNSLEWIRQYRPEDYAQKFIQLVDCRRKLLTRERVSQNNPAIAAFGKSQVGKSYLISCMLQNDGKSFKVKSKDREYDFAFQINPPSTEAGGVESTGVVTRFSSYSRDPKSYSKDYPVMVATFSVADVILILADSYYNDSNNYQTKSESELAKVCDEYKEKYQSCPKVASPLVSADDILDMKEYFLKQINNAQVFNHSSFFDHIAMVIEHVPVDDYPKIFSELWYNDENVTHLFVKLFGILSRLGFARHIYLPIESVVHEGVREKTIMSVQCLNQLFDDSSPYTTDAYVMDGKEMRCCATGVPKSHICAVCSEVVFKIEDDFLDSSGSYCMDDIDPGVAARLNHGQVSMSMFRTNDLLDFPGARSRLNVDVAKLSDNSLMMQCFLRGKVAYLFNKYNMDSSINVLLYCHHNQDNDVTSLYKLLEDWVEEYVGRTPDERRRKLELTKVSPLFYIGTMFNLDMKLGVGETPSEGSVNQRWNSRFDVVLNRQCFYSHAVEWVNNWTRQGEPFSNSYVLRDYKFSGVKSSRLYSGFDESGRETGMMIDRQYYDMLRATFVSNDFVKQRFRDPAASWDVAASINNDGALYIMENLAVVAERMDEARESDFAATASRIRDKVFGIMDDYHIPDDENELLEGNISKAKSIFREMDFACNTDNYYFGHLLQAFQVSESSVYRVVHAVMQGTDLNSMVNDFKNYEIIIDACKNAGCPLSDGNSEDENWNSLIRTYGFKSRDEAAAYLVSRGVDAGLLFRGPGRRKVNSRIIADSVYDDWCSTIKSVDFMSGFSGGVDFDSSVMSLLVDDYVSMADWINLREYMSEAIADYVNVIHLHLANESFLADILASIINDFVLDFGFKYLPDSKVDEAREICEGRHLQAFNYMLKSQSAVCDEASLTMMFDEMSRNPRLLLPSFEDNYNKWKEYMTVSFVARLKVTSYDVEANETLGKILEGIKSA